MNFNLGFSQLNGTEQDELSATIDRMSKSELDTLLSDQDAIKELAKNSPELNKMMENKEACMLQNKEAAVANLTFQPILETKKAELSQAYELLADAKNQYQILKSEMDSIGSKYSAHAILELLQAATAEIEERSEIADRFLKKSIDVDTFIKEFLPVRTLYNERRFKVEQLAESLAVRIH